MFILIDIKKDLSYVSKCLNPLSLIVGYSTQTLRNWLRDSEIATKKGYILRRAELVKTRHKVNKRN